MTQYKILNVKLPNSPVNKSKSGIKSETEGFLMLTNPLTNLEIQNYFQNQPKLKGLSSKYNLPRINDGAYVINLDKCQSIGTHWIAFNVNGDTVTCFDSFGVEYVPKEIKKPIGNKNITTNIYKIQPNDSIMCGYFCTGFVEFMLKEW